MLNLKQKTMRKSFKIILFLLLAVPALFIGCQKSEVLDDSKAPVKSVPVILPYTPCGNQLVANLYEYGNTGTSYGTVTVANDLVNLYIKYQVNPEYLIRGTFLYVGTAEGLTTLLPNPSSPETDGTGHFHVGSFPYQNYPNATSFTKIIPLSSLPDCFVIVAFADIPVVSAPYGYVRVSAKVPTALKSSGYYLDYCKQVCSSGCETAYAYGNGLANCFLSIPGVTSNNWGWSNGPIVAGPGTYSWPIYAGAGQCDITKGTLVGTLNVVYNGSSATITFNMGGNVHLSTTHLYVGNDILAKKNNKWTTAPGQFPYKHETLNGANSDSFTINGLSGSIYIAAHSGVCW